MVEYMHLPIYMSNIVFLIVDPSLFQNHILLAVCAFMWCYFSSLFVLQKAYNAPYCSYGAGPMHLYLAHMEKKIKIYGFIGVHFIRFVSLIDMAFCPYWFTLKRIGLFPWLLCFGWCNCVILFIFLLLIAIFVIFISSSRWVCVWIGNLEVVFVHC